MRQSLSDVSGVTKVDVDFASGMATCTVQSDVEDATLVAAVPDRYKTSIGP